tara:strand:- start:6087 stop:7058 length:972 start_codon:yes stop_codon:yes gene_type:complete
MDYLAPSFSVTLADIDDPTILNRITPQQKVRLYTTNGNSRSLALTGYIDKRERSRSGNNSSFSISGRAATGDLVDCSATSFNRTFTQVNISRLATEISSPFVRVLQDITELAINSPIYEYSLQNDTTVFEVLNEIASRKGAMFLTDAYGNLVVTQAFRWAHAGANLVDGKNILSLSEKWDVKKLFSEYIVKGQSKNSLGELDSGLSATIKDTSVPRDRPKIITVEGNQNALDLYTVGGWELSTRNARAKQYTVKVQGWYPEGSAKRWQINTTVDLISQTMDIRKSLVVSDVELSQDASGTTTTMVLREPGAYAPAPTVPEGTI